MIAYKSTNGFIYICHNTAQKVAPKEDAVLLNLSLVDLYKLLSSSEDWCAKVGGANDVMMAPIVGNDALVKTFTELNTKYNPSKQPLVISTDAVKTQRIVDNSVDIAKKLPKITTVDNDISAVKCGTSKLVRISSRGIIKIAKRSNAKEKDKHNYHDSVLIPDNLREQFFEDVKSSQSFQNLTKWELTKAYDEQLYNKWSVKMSELFLKYGEL